MFVAPKTYTYLSVVLIYCVELTHVVQIQYSTVPTDEVTFTSEKRVADQ
jgi:hypothetical protein